MDATRKPLIPSGSTPLRNSIASFRSWYSGCNDTRDSSFDCDDGDGDWTGWSDYAAAHDTNWSCRKKYLLVLTDGDETCPTPDSDEPCMVGEITGALNNPHDTVRTFVVGYGVDSGTSNQLTCMADRGGTFAPIYPQNSRSSSMR